MSDRTRYRLYEILPGLSVWGTLLGSLIFAILFPVRMIYLVLLFDIYWLLKVCNFSWYLLIAWWRFSWAKRQNWKQMLLSSNLPWQDKKHIVFLTLYNESWEVVETAIDSIVRGVYKKESFVLVVAGEERKKEHAEDIYKRVKSRFSEYVFDVILTMHPANMPDEIPGKGSNLHFSERQMQKYIDKQGWVYEEVIATMFDIDTICHESYFAYLTYTFCNQENPTRMSYQPIALYNNNMWESPGLLRMMAFGTTFWTMTSLARQDALVTFSSHSMSFRAIVDAGFHDKRIVSEDSRIFYQCLLAYQGDYSVCPLYLPVSMDTVRDDSFIKSVRNLYFQQRRWAWGVEHVPYLLYEFGKKTCRVPFLTKLKWVFLEWEGKWSWCLVPILITVLGRLPLFVAPDSVRASALYFNAPHVFELFMTLSMMGLLLTAVFSFPLLPPRPQSHPRYLYIGMALQWLLLPFTMIFISSIPAIAAVTHMMRGTYLGFNISQKKRSVQQL